MASSIFTRGGGAGIGSYVLVFVNGVLDRHTDMAKVRGAYDSGDNIFLSIIDEGTSEALVPASGWIDEQNRLHLVARDFDDDKTYKLLIGENAHEADVEIADGIDMGDTEIPDAEYIEAQLAGKADLVDGKVPADQLPGYVDDIAEFDSMGDFPEVGEDDKIYLAKDTNLTYRWSGSEYVQINARDSVLSFGSEAEFPDEGETNVIYIDEATNLQYRWDGSDYAQLSPEKEIKTFLVSQAEYSSLVAGQPVAIAAADERHALVDEGMLRFSVEGTQLAIVMNRLKNMNGVVAFEFIDYSPTNRVNMVYYFTFTESSGGYELGMIKVSVPQVEKVQDMIAAAAPDLSVYYTKTEADALLDGKVDKAAGKGLSDENFTPEEKEKLGGIEAGAQVNAVSSVAGKTGAVALAKGDVGLGNVDDTSDADKPVSTAQQTALNGKQDVLVSGENIKTINNQSILGSGDLTIGGGGSAITIDEGALNIGPGAIPTPVALVDGVPFFHEGHSFDLQAIADAVVAAAKASLEATAFLVYDALTGEEIDTKIIDESKRTRPIVEATAMQLPVALGGVEAEPTYGYIVAFARFANARPYALLANFDTTEQDISDLPASELGFDICDAEDLNKDDDQADEVCPFVALPDYIQFGVLWNKTPTPTFVTYYNALGDYVINSVKSGDNLRFIMDSRIAFPEAKDEGKVLTVAEYGRIIWNTLRQGVIEVTDHESLPQEGVAGTIYITQNTNKQYRWNGSTYVELGPEEGVEVLDAEIEPEPGIEMLPTRYLTAEELQKVIEGKLLIRSRGLLCYYAGKNTAGERYEQGNGYYEMYGLATEAHYDDTFPSSQVRKGGLVRIEKVTIDPDNDNEVSHQTRYVNYIANDRNNFLDANTAPSADGKRIIREMNVAGKLVPSYAISDALKVLRVDVNGNGLEFATVESGGGGGSDIETAIIDLPPDTSGLVTRGVIEPVVLGKIVANPQIYMLKTPQSQNPIPLLSLYTKDSAKLVYRTETVETKTADDYGESHFVLKTYLVTITLETGAWVLTERTDLLAPTLYGETKVCDYYSINKQYAVGDYANYRGVMYRCTQAHKATSTFKPAYWVRTNAMTEMNALLPAYVAADAGKVLKVNANGDGLEFATDNAGVSAQEVQNMIDAAIGNVLNQEF